MSGGRPGGRDSFWAHWSVGAAGIALLAGAVVAALLTGLTFEEMLGSRPRRPAEIAVVSAGGIGAVALLLWMRATTAQRVARGGDR